LLAAAAAVARSIDHGESYSIADLGPVSGMQGCNVAAGPAGDVFVSWRTFDNNPKNSNPQDSGIFVARSTDGGATFGSAAHRQENQTRYFSAVWRLRNRGKAANANLDQAARIGDAGSCWRWSPQSPER
jgi:hypothetical protein